MNQREKKKKIDGYWDWRLLGCYHLVYELEKGGGKTEHTVQFNKKKKKAIIEISKV